MYGELIDSSPRDTMVIYDSLVDFRRSLSEYENTSLDGPAFHLFSESLAQKLQENLSKRAEESGIMATKSFPEEGFSAPFPKVAAICSRCAIVHAPNGASPPSMLISDLNGSGG